MKLPIDLSPQSWGRVIATTLVVTAACVTMTIIADADNLVALDPMMRARSLLTDIIVPIALGVPLLLFFSIKLRELAIAHKRLTILASTDSLTQVMSRPAFSTLVDAYLSEVHADGTRQNGALLLIDADNFKAVNDTFGHQRGDEALVSIASAIKMTVRAPDLVGRLGGEEFGVFLPGATPVQAELVAERIRRSVLDHPLVVDDTFYKLSVSVGGAIFTGQLPFKELFRQADQQLYAAKSRGRNRVAMAPPGIEPARAAA